MTIDNMISCTIEDIYDFYNNFPQYTGKLKVKTQHGPKYIEQCDITSYNSDVIKVTTNNRSIKTSPDHLLYTNDWAKVKTLHVGDIIETIDGPEMINDISLCDYKDDLYDIQVEGVKEYYANGFISHNSSIMELIPFGLFGKTIKKIKKEKIVNWYNEKQCEVILRFAVDGINYEVTRGIKPNVTKLLINGILQRSPASVADFQAQIEEIIGMDFKTFQNLIYFSPNNTISIINAGKGEKRKFLESLFDLSVYSDMMKTVNYKTTLQESILFNLERDNETIERDLSRLRKEIEDSSIPNTRKYRDKANMVRLQLNELQKIEYTISAGDVVLHKSLLQTSKDLLEEWGDKNRNSVAVVDLNQKLIKSLGDIDGLEDKRNDLYHQQGNLAYDMDLTNQKDRDKVADKTQQKDIRKAELVELIDAIAILDKERSMSLFHLSNALRNLQDEQDRDMKEGECDSCGQVITSEYLQKQQIDNLASLQETYDVCKVESEEMESEMTTHVHQKDELYKEIKEESDDIKELESLIEKSGLATLEHTQIQQRIDDLPDVDELKKQLEQYRDALISHKDICIECCTKILMIEIDIEQQTDRLTKLEEELKKRVSHDEALVRVESELKQADNYYNEMKKLADKVTKDNEKKEGQINQLEETSTNNIDKMQKTNNLTNYLNVLKVALKDENVKKHAISSLMPYLNTQTNRYLSESGFPYIVDVDSWLDVEIRGLGIKEVDYGQLSGGELKTIDMAVQLACNDIASMMAKTSMNIMILDEVLDSSVDSIGVQTLLDIVRVRQIERNDSVYVITHRNEIDDFTFDNVVQIEKENGFSRVEVN